MWKTRLLTICLVLSTLIFACSRSDTNRNATVTISGEPIGVTECDSFLNAYETCISSTKVPETNRAQFRGIMTTWRTDWKKLAENPQTRPGLVNACKQQLELARVQMKAYGCTF
jgi:hypothetical protein